MKSESDRPITIEDLLRLKRAERPPAEFWTTFDRELRAKQLSALVAKRPWWQTMPKSFPRIFRYRIALGASAVAALTLISLRTDRSAPVEVAGQPVAVEASAEVASATSPTFVVTATAPELSPLVVQSIVAVSTVASEVPIAAPAFADTSVATHRTPAQADGINARSDVEAPSPSAIVIAANLADIRGAEADISRTSLVKNNGFEVRSASARSAVEPLQQMTPPGEFRRSRLLTAMVSTASSEGSYRTTERAASRIDEERLYDQINRFGARGDRVNLKF